MGAADKTLRVLDLFLDTRDTLGVTEVARMTGMNPTTAYRTISSLVKSGYLEKHAKGRKYSISGRKIVAFSRVVMTRMKIRNMALPFLRDLSEVVNETTQLALCLGNVAFNLDTIYTNQMLRVHPSKENTIDLYSTGVGKVFLAHMAAAELDEYCRSIDFWPRTPNTITEEKELRKELAWVREEGVSYDREEHEIGIVGIAAPVKDPSGTVVAAVGVIAPKLRVDRQRMAEIGEAVKDYAEKVSGALRHYQNYPAADGLYVTEASAGDRVD